MAKAISYSLIDVVRVAPLAPMGDKRSTLITASAVYIMDIARHGKLLPPRRSLSGNDRPSQQIASQEIATVTRESQLDRSS
jgi:hypothetical protein